jgi:hypothetical protein
MAEECADLGDASSGQTIQEGLQAMDEMTGEEKPKRLEAMAKDALDNTPPEESVEAVIVGKESVEANIVAKNLGEEGDKESVDASVVADDPLGRVAVVGVEEDLIHPDARDDLGLLDGNEEEEGEEEEVEGEEVEEEEGGDEEENQLEPGEPGYDLVCTSFLF